MNSHPQFGIIFIILLSRQSTHRTIFVSATPRILFHWIFQFYEMKVPRILNHLRNDDYKIKLLFKASMVETYQTYKYINIQIIICLICLLIDFKYFYPPSNQGNYQYNHLQIKRKFMKKNQKRLTYEEKFNKCEQFIKNFEDYDLQDVKPIYELYGRRKYMIKLQQIANEELDSYQILMEDLETYFRKDEEKELIQGFKTNTQRFMSMFEQIADKLIPQRNINMNPQNEIRQRFQNILNIQRKDNINSDGARVQNQMIPKQTYRNYNLSIVYGPSSKFKIDCISDFTSEKIGSLVVCKAIVIRATEVKPELVIGTYTCDHCGCENYYEVNNEQFGPMIKCQSKICIQNNTSGKLTFLPGHSKFICYQEIKIQETPDQLQQGKIPRNFSIQMRGNLVKQATPGDIVMVQGILLPRRKPGYSNDLLFTLHMVATKIIRQKKKYVEMNINQQRIAEIQNIRSNCTDEEIFEKLTKSIAPQIYGLENVKKALLLLMTGGVTKVTQDNLKIRGQINIALFGDPGIAKSQLLKHISYLAPRGVYTTGKGSSGVGLTAAVVRDPYTQQLALQAGALVLADMGVCCIDQFDKMDQYDRTAIHEVMEQQTISIAKAGITTSLNARTSILAAANPLYGRYNKAISAQKNINLPAALLSRFDLIFILLDSCEQAKDVELAKHIGFVHRSGRAPFQSDQVFSPEFIRAYIALSKQYNPVLPAQLHQEIIERYTKKRQQQMDLTKEGESYTTMRSLLALLRLAQARAKLRFSNQISKADISDALLLIEQSQKSVITRYDGKKQAKQDVAKVFEIIKDMCVYNKEHSIEYDTLLKVVLARGFTEDVLEIVLTQYDHLGVLMRTQNKVVIIDQS